MKAFGEAEARKKPNPELMFTDVYDEMPPHLEKQLQAMKDHVAKHKEHYPLDQYDKMT